MRNFFERRRQNAVTKAAYQSLSSLSDQVLSDVGATRATVVAMGELPAHIIANLELTRALSRSTGG